MTKWEFLLEFIDWVLWGFALGSIVLIAGFVILFIAMVLGPK